MRPGFRRVLVVLVAMVAIATVAVLAVAQTTPSPALVVLSKGDHTLAIVDPADLKVIAKIPVGDDPHEVAASDDGKTAYVTNYGYGAYHTITPVDLVAQKPLPVIDTGALIGPHGIMFRNGEVWFTAEVAKAVARYNPATGKIDWIMGTGQNRTHMIYVSPDARHVITTNVNSGTMTIMEKYDTPPGATLPGVPQGAILPPGSDWLLTNIPTGTRDEGFAVSPDMTQAWTASPVDGSVTIVDIASKKVIATLQVFALGANRLKFTPDGKLVLVSAGPNLVVIDAATHKVIKRLALGRGTGGILVEPDDKRAFVACGPDNYVAVIDLDSLEVTGHIDVGGSPDGMAWAARQ